MSKLLIWIISGFVVLVLAIVLFRSPGKKDEYFRLMTRGKGFYEKGDVTNAIAIYMEATKVAPESLDARLNLASACLLAGDSQNAIEQSQQALNLDHNSAAAYYLMGCAYLRLNQAESAVKALQQSQHIDPAVTALNFQLGLALDLLGHTEEAITEFEKVGKFEPQHPSIHYQLSRLYQRVGRAADAAQEMQKHQQVQAKNSGSPSGPATFERCKYTVPRIAFALEQPDPRGMPVRFVEATATAFAQPGNFHGPMAVVDFNHDGRNSLFVSEGDTGFRLLNNVGGRFDPLGELLPGKPQATYRRVLVGDLNNDRAEDIVVLGEQASHAFSIATNGRVREVTAMTGLRTLQAHDGLLADLDFTGKLDLLTVLPSGRGLRLFRNLGNSYFQDGTADSGLPAAFAGAEQLTVEDWNNEDVPGVFVAQLGKPPTFFAKQRAGAFVATNSGTNWPAGSVNFQTVVTDLTGLPLANASLLDEATAAAEAMAMCLAISRSSGLERTEFFASQDCHPQTIAVMQTRAEPLGMKLRVGRTQTIDFSNPQLAGILLQYPTTDGYVGDYSALVAQAHASGVLVVVATDLLALTLLRPPGEFGADIAIGSSQRFGVPLGFGGPHAAFLAAAEPFKRQIPGRIVGVSKDVTGKTAYRLSLQTREQHIRREKATSNICTAQVLLAIMASMYAVYHGPEGLRKIAARAHGLAVVLAEGLRQLGFDVATAAFFDTILVRLTKMQSESIMLKANEAGINLRWHEDHSIGIALDEVSTEDEIRRLMEIFVGQDQLPFDLKNLSRNVVVHFPPNLARTSRYLTHEVFNRYHAEHEMLRYIHRLEAKDLSLVHSMIPLGSCTMKLNATAEMLPVTWPEFSRLHPFAPIDQTKGYRTLFRRFESWLAEITGLSAVSLQPNAGSQGEYTGLMLIRAYHRSRGEEHRDICLIPLSAHGTNPASAAMVGMTVF